MTAFRIGLWRTSLATGTALTATLATTVTARQLYPLPGAVVPDIAALVMLVLSGYVSSRIFVHGVVPALWAAAENVAAANNTKSTN